MSYAESKNINRAVDVRAERKTMYVNQSQFGARSSVDETKPKFKMNKNVGKNYPQLLEQIHLQNEQAKLREHTCFPWQLNCKLWGTHP